MRISYEGGPIGALVFEEMLRTEGLQTGYAVRDDTDAAVHRAEFHVDDDGRGEARQRAERACRRVNARLPHVRTFVDGDRVGGFPNF